MQVEVVSQSLFGEEGQDIDEIGSSSSSDESEEDDEEENDEEDNEAGDIIGGGKAVDTVVDEANGLIRNELGLGNKSGGRTVPSGHAPAKKRSRYSEVYTPQF